MIQEIKDNNLASLMIAYKKLSLVYFWAPWCNSCKSLAPFIEEISEKYDGKVLIIKINVDENPKTVSEHGIKSIPTLICFKNGKEICRKIGVNSQNTLTKELDKLICK